MTEDEEKLLLDISVAMLDDMTAAMERKLALVDSPQHRHFLAMAAVSGIMGKAVAGLLEMKGETITADRMVEATQEMFNELQRNVLPNGKMPKDVSPFVEKVLRDREGREQVLKMTYETLGRKGGPPWEELSRDARLRWGAVLDSQLNATQEMIKGLEDRARYALPISQLKGEPDGAALVNGKNYLMQDGQLYGPQDETKH